MDLHSKELIVVTGKGGVGKSVASAALGRVLSAAGRRTLVVETDSRESLYRFFGVAPSDGGFVRVDEGLWYQNLDPRSVLHDVVKEQLRFDFLVDRITRSDIFRQFTAGAPGLKALALLGHALRVLRRISSGTPEVDVVVLDAPATGHGLAIVGAPALVGEVIRDGPFGRMAADLGEMMADPSRTGAVVVTAAEEMAIDETLELIAGLQSRLGRGPELVVVNSVYPEGASGLARRRREVNEVELERLCASWADPVCVWPLLPLTGGPDLVKALASRLAAHLAGVSPESP